MEQFVWLSLLFAILAVTNIFLIVYASYWGSGRMLIARFSLLLVGIYILARIGLFMLGFTTLRGLPPQALNIITTHWPHFLLIFTGN